MWTSWLFKMDLGIIRMWAVRLRSFRFTLTVITTCPKNGDTLSTHSTWEWRALVLRWSDELICPSLSVTTLLDSRKKLPLSLDEKHALLIRIIGVRRTCFGEDYFVPLSSTSDYARSGWSAWFYRTLGDNEYCCHIGVVLYGETDETLNSSADVMCLGLRVFRELSYLSHDRGANYMMSNFLEVLL